MVNDNVYERIDPPSWKVGSNNRELSCATPLLSWLSDVVVVVNVVMNVKTGKRRFAGDVVAIKFLPTPPKGRGGGGGDASRSLVS